MGCLHSLISTLDLISDVGFREPGIGNLSERLYYYDS